MFLLTIYPKGITVEQSQNSPADCVFTIRHYGTRVGVFYYGKEAEEMVRKMIK